MSRKIAAALAASAIGAIAMLMSLPATAAPTTVMGKVGPGYTISLTIGGKKVKKLKAGVKYRFVIADRSEDHDFRLKGPGTSKVLSGEGFRGTKVAVLALRKGTYSFYCAPHSDEMYGRFNVA
jgi:plastocyanin